MPLDLKEAGRRLAERLVGLLGEDTIVMAIPRRGMVVGHAIARALDLPLDAVFATAIHDRSRVAPVGAVALGEARVLAPEAADVAAEHLDQLFALALAELDERMLALRGDSAMPDLHGRVVVVVDDVARTGYTLEAAVTAVARHLPARLLATTALSSHTAAQRVAPLVDGWYCLEETSRSEADAFHGLVAATSQLTDATVRGLLIDAHRGRVAGDDDLEIDGLDPLVDRPAPDSTGR